MSPRGGFVSRGPDWMTFEIHVKRIFRAAMANFTSKGSSAAVIHDRALRVAEARYRRIFETAQDGIVVLNADTGQIDDINPYLIKMLGYSYEEFLGKNIWDVGLIASRTIQIYNMKMVDAM